MSSLIEAVNNYSLSELRKERDKWNQITEDKKQQILEMTDEYNQAQAHFRLIDSAVRMRETLEGKNGHKAQLIFRPVTTTASTSVGDSETSGQTDKTSRMLEILRQGNGLEPGKLYRAMLEAGIPVRRPYVSTVLQRFKKRNKVRVENGKYFAVD
jgi:hypothetical protein